MTGIRSFFSGSGLTSQLAGIRYNRRIAASSGRFIQGGRRACALLSALTAGLALAGTAQAETLLNAKMTAGQNGSEYGYRNSPSIGSIIDDTFTYNGTDYTVTKVYAEGTDVVFDTDPEIPLTDLNALTMTVKDTVYQGGWSSDGGHYRQAGNGLGLTRYEKVALWIGDGLPPRPSNVSNLTRIEATFTTMKLKWNGSSHATSYRVHYRKWGGGRQVKTVADTETRLTGLEPGIIYEIRVFGHNAAGESRDAPRMNWDTTQAPRIFAETRKGLFYTTMTVGTNGNEKGYRDTWSTSSIWHNTFTYKGTDYTLKRVSHDDTNIYFETDPLLSPADLHDLWIVVSRDNSGSSVSRNKYLGGWKAGTDHVFQAKNGLDLTVVDDPRVLRSVTIQERNPTKMTMKVPFMESGCTWKESDDPFGYKWQSSDHVPVRHRIQICDTANDCTRDGHWTNVKTEGPDGSGFQFTKKADNILAVHYITDLDATKTYKVRIGYYSVVYDKNGVDTGEGYGWEYSEPYSPRAIVNESAFPNTVEAAFVWWKADLTAGEHTAGGVTSVGYLKSENAGSLSPGGTFMIGDKNYEVTELYHDGSSSSSSLNLKVRDSDNDENVQLPIASHNNPKLIITAGFHDDRWRTMKNNWDESAEAYILPTFEFVNGKTYPIRLIGHKAKPVSEISIDPYASLLETTMTAGGESGTFGYWASATTPGSIGDDTFTHDGTDYTLKRLNADGTNIYFATEPQIALADLDTLMFTVKDKTYLGDWTANTNTGTPDHFYQGKNGLSIADGDTGITVKIEKGSTSTGGMVGPMSLGATPGNGQAQLGWQMPGAGGQGASGQSASDTPDESAPSYEVAWTQEGSDWSEGGSQTVDAMEATVSGLENGQTYAFRVRARQGEETSIWSDTTFATPGTTPGAPDAPTATNAGDGTLMVSWTAPEETGISNIVGYELDAVVKGADWNVEPRLTGLTETSAEVGDLTYDTEYALRVRVVSGTGRSEWSETIHATPVASSVSVVQPFADLAMANASVRRLDFAEHFSGSGLSFEVMVTTTNKRSGEVKTAPINTVARNKVTGVWSDAVLTLTVAPSGHHVLGMEAIATDDSGTSASGSFRLTVDATGQPGRPDAPTAVAGEGEIAMSWAAPSEDGGLAIASYDLDVGIDGDWSAGPDTITGITGTGRTVAGLAGGTAYRFRIRAVNSAGAGEWSEATHATPVAPGLSLIRPFADLAMANGSVRRLDFAEHFSGSGLSFEVMVTTTHKGTGEVKTAPINTVARNKVTGVRSEDVLTLTAGPSGRHVLTLAVTATDGDGGTASDSFRLTVDATGQPGRPDAPTAVAGDGEIAVSWTAPSEDGGLAIASYDLDVGIDGDRSAGPDTITGMTGTSETVSGLTNGTAYRFRIRAVNGAGAGE